MFFQLLAGAFISFVNFGLHAMMTGLIVMATNHTAERTDHLHVFGRVAALMTVTVTALMVAHAVEIAVWALFYAAAGVPVPVSEFEFAFENYTALGYGDAIAGGDWRLIGPITALNGLLLIGWSVAIIFEVMRMAEVQVIRLEDRPNRRRTPKPRT